MSGTVGTVLTQPEADALMALVKRFVGPPPAISIPPAADDRYELTAAKVPAAGHSRRVTESRRLRCLPEVEPCAAFPQEKPHPTRPGAALYSAGLSRRPVGRRFH